MSAPVRVNIGARLIDASETPQVPLAPSSWFITHGLGKPAEHTFTEVAFADDVLELLADLHDDIGAERILEETVREVAALLYGGAWAFLYRPEQYDEAITRHNMRRREVVVVYGIEVLS